MQDGVYDVVGLDLHTRVTQNLRARNCINTRIPEKIRNLVKAGHFGTKTGKGIYDYTPASIAARRSRRDQRLLALLKMFYSWPPLTVQIAMRKRQLEKSSSPAP